MSNEIVTLDLTKNSLLSSPALKERIAKQHAEAQAKMMAENENIGLPFISLKGGTMKLRDQVLPNNAFVGIVLAERYEKTYYSKVFNPNDVVSPDCFALGSDENDLKPHENVASPKSERCQGCSFNQFETAMNGRGKACRDQIRVAILMVNECRDFDNPHVIDDPEFYNTANIVYLRVPPTSLKNYKAFRNSLINAKVTPHVIYTKIYATIAPNNTYPILSFEPFCGIEDMAVLDKVEAKQEMANNEIGLGYRTESEGTETTSPAATSSQLKSPKKAAF